ncbi:MAG: succinate dehydrogenase, cytochrome b556 subunit [Chloroflexi bacterium]|nr:succinate dehydrogenase, cytochrome b556 subunit [Chloroflexota bacterium]
MNGSRLRNTLYALDWRGRRAGWLAFLLNRLTALALTFYLGLHLAVLHKLTQGAAAYDDFIALAQSPLFKAGEVILIAAAVYHGLNGLRVMLLAFGAGLSRQKALFILSAIAAALVAAAFAVRMGAG